MSSQDDATEGSMQWVWATDLDALEAQLRYRYGRGHFAETTDEGQTLRVGNTWPEDITDEDDDEPTLQMYDVVYYAAPLYTGNGYYVTRLPPRAVMGQLFREESHTNPDVPSATANPAPALVDEPDSTPDSETEQTTLDDTSN